MTPTTGCMALFLAGALALGTHAVHATPPPAREVTLDSGWKFLRLDDAAPTDYSGPRVDETHWQSVTLPHTPRIEPLVADAQWQGLCWYRRSLTMPLAWQGRKVFLDFGAAMSVADVWVNGRHETTHYGGYLPFTVDMTPDLHSGTNTIAIRLDNRDNAEVPPGKSYKTLDFDWYGGLYRHVTLRVTDRLHITEATEAERPAGGGVFVTYPNVTSQRAAVQVKVQVLNEYPQAQAARAEFALTDAAGRIVAGATTSAAELAPDTDHTFIQTLQVTHPKLWDPDHPNLYHLRSVVLRGATPVDAVEARLGIRRIAFSAAGGFQINGKRMYLRGCDRHQEYPYLGYALSDDAQYRDAVKIKQAGFDFIRLSHYPQSPAFLDACDQLGLVVMEPIPGWQYMGDAVFQERSIQNVREMIRRDRNHPCVALWETSLNETFMPQPFMARLKQAAHEEYPGDQCYTAGWQDAFDVFIQSRQAGGLHDFKNGDEASLISEYGDWEYYARNMGLDQTAGRDKIRPDLTSRQTRADGEAGMLQQASNFQQAANDNRSTPAVADAIWVMYDYSRGYARDLETSGTMDSLRLPKFAYWFFQSQRDADAAPIAGVQSGPMVHIASYWNAQSPTSVRVFSNCAEVALYRDGRLIARQKPDTDADSMRLPHPPFTFALAPFTPGTLKAVGLISSVARTSETIRTPGSPAALRLRVDTSGRPLRADGADAVFVYADVVDASGTVVPSSDIPVQFTVTGPARLVGTNPLPATAGIAGILLQAQNGPGSITVHATVPGLSSGTLTVVSR